MPEPKERRWAFMSKKIIGAQDNPMLIRWRVIQTPWFGIYLHFIHREDLDRLPHDHPWTFWTLILRGSYTEEFYPDSRFIGRQGYHPRNQLRHRWSWRKFSEVSAHRITAVSSNVTTLVFVGRKDRTWGFYDGLGNFIPWREYHAVANGWSEQQRHQAMREMAGVVPGAQRCTLCGRCRGHHHPRIAGHPFQVDVAIEDTWPGKLGRINYDPTYGSIDKDIQEFVAKVYGTKDVSRRAAVENTLQEKRERGETLILDTSGSIL